MIWCNANCRVQLMTQNIDNSWTFNLCRNVNWYFVSKNSNVRKSLHSLIETCYYETDISCLWRKYLYIIYILSINGTILYFNTNLQLVLPCTIVALHSWKMLVSAVLLCFKSSQKKAVYGLVFLAQKRRRFWHPISIRTMKHVLCLQSLKHIWATAGPLRLLIWPWSISAKLDGFMVGENMVRSTNRH
jgi:hypothetical protein